MHEDFDRDGFLNYLEENFAGFVSTEGIYLRELIENIINYAHDNKNNSKDQFCYFLSDLLPEVGFGEIAVFMDDKYLTENGKFLKVEALQNRFFLILKIII